MPAARDCRPAAAAPAQLDSSRFDVARFEVISTGRSGTLLGLSLHAPFELSAHVQPTLIIVHDEVEPLYTPGMAAGSRHELAGGSWLWRGIFPVAPDLARDSDALFSLRLFDALTIGLPVPAQLAGAAQLAGTAPSDSHRPGRRWPYALRRGALLFVVSCQLCLLPAIASPGALAEGTAGSVLSEATPESTPETPAEPRVAAPPPAAPRAPPGTAPARTERVGGTATARERDRRRPTATGAGAFSVAPPRLRHSKVKRRPRA